VRWPWLLAALASLAACAAPPQAAEPEPSGAPAAAPASLHPQPNPPGLTDADLHGRWRIVSLNARAPAGLAEDSPGERTPYLAFSPLGYGGNTGCNSFGGYGVHDGARYYASGAGQTAMGCGDLTAQEETIIGILTASPRMLLSADGRLTLTAARGTMVVVRDRSAAPFPPPPDWGERAILAGTVWRLAGVDGAWLHEPGRRTLAFEADRWSLSSECGATGGAWRQRGDRIEARPDPVATRACRAEAAAIDDRLIALLAARARFVTGPNGEILIGGGGHWATGERPRPILADEAPLLAGNWRIAAIDGAEPAPASEPRIAFGPTGFSGSTGCNSMQGNHIAHARRLFAAPPVMTQMGCGGALAAQERRIASLLAAAPRIALAGEEGIALVDENGSLLLRREGAAPWAPVGRLWAGEALEAELTMLDGAPLQEHYSQPGTRLRLTAQRFDIYTGCGRLGGIWRRQGVAPPPAAIEFLTDPEPPPEGACAGALVARLPVFSRMLNGPARLLVGASGELIVAGEHHWLVGRVLPPSTRRRR